VDANNSIGFVAANIGIKQAIKNAKKTGIGLVGIKNSDVLSPTFNIVYDYDIGNIKILHYDLYRLKNYKDISQLGMFETSNDSIKIVEWPELIESKPKDRVDIQFQYSKLIDSRKVKIVGFGKWKDYKFKEI